MNKLDRFIADCASFDDFRVRACAWPNTKDQGDAFERLVQVYLQTEPAYQIALEKVWRLSEAPPLVLREIGLPRDDFGIDIIARHVDGSYWAVQAKFRTDEEVALGWGDLSTFVALASEPRRNISLSVVAHTIARPVGRRDLMNRMVEIGLSAFRQADWSLIQRTILENAPARPTPSSPSGKFAWQQTVIDMAVGHFRVNARGRVQVPCGTGKSKLAYFIADALQANTIVVAVPSLQLMKQCVDDWTAEEVARGHRDQTGCASAAMTRSVRSMT